MYQSTPMTEKELREALLYLTEDLRSDVLLLECLSRADLSDCCAPADLEPLHRRLHDYISQHSTEIADVAGWLVTPPTLPSAASIR